MGRRVWVLGLSWVLAGCIVPRPDPEAITRFPRFRTPEETFQSVRTAFQGELLDWEYTCFSQDFVKRNSLSRLAYRGFRPDLMQRLPHLRWGLSRAVVQEVELGEDGRRAILRARVPLPFLSDPVIVLRLVREEYADLWLGDEVVGQVYGPSGTPVLFDPDQPRVLVDTSSAGQLGHGWVWLAIDLTRPLTPEELAGGFSLVRAAREWKVDDISVE